MNRFLSKISRITTACVVTISTLFGNAGPLLVNAETRARINYDGNAIVEEAKKHIGKGYVWGAEGPNVFDCSGFTQYVFRQCGHNIPRVAEDQRKFMMQNTVELPKSDMSKWEKGDLVFYGNSGYADHVAIYVGDGYVIDCLGSQVSSLPGVSKHKIDAIVDKNGHKYTILGIYDVENLGKLQIKKVSEQDNKPLKGAVFEIINNANGSKKTKTTNSNGVINFEDLEPGTYTIREVKAPEGYFITNEEKVVTIKGGETISDNVLVFTNKKHTGKIILTKYNHDKSLVIPNTEYEVRYPDGTLKIEKTNAKGQIVLDNLTLFGIYTFTEVKAAPGYIVDTYPLYVKLSSEGATSPLVVKEVEHINYEPTGTLILTKKDSATGGTAQGDATFEGAKYAIKADEDIWNNAHTKLVYKKGTVVATRVAKADGTMEPIRGLYMGRYIVYETNPPKGYVLNPTPYTVQFTKEDETKQIVKYLNVEDDVISGNVAINKVTDATNDGSTRPLEFIPFILTDSHGKQWDGITDEQGYLEFNDLPYGKYVLTEQPCENNEGLSLEKNKEIIIDGTKRTYEYTIVNHATTMKFHKIDAETKNPLKGATLVVTQKGTGFIVDEWVSDGNPYEIKGLIEGNEYTLQEVKAPANYKLASPIHFVAKDGGSVTLENARKVENVDITFSKKDITSKEELPGARLMIKEYETNKIIKQWVSTNTPTVVKLEKGKKYIFEETLAPAGYVQAEMIIFTAGDAKVITMFDDYTKVSIQKVDENNKPLEGAKLQLSKEDGTVVKTWTSTKEALLLTKLARGKYVLTELEAPAGYEIAKPVHFEVINDAKVINVKMVDKVKPEVPEELEMLMSKQDITSKKELPGAKMQLIDKATGKVVDSWTSTTTPHKVTVIKGKEYILSEVTAPDGYLKAENITFTAGEAKTITMYDDYTKVLIQKVDENNKPVEGAKLQLSKEDGTIVKTWTSTKDALLFTKLAKGKYVLTELEAPAGYEIAKPVHFEVIDSAKVINVKMVDKLKPEVPEELEMLMSKQDITSKKELPGAKMQLIDKATGKVVDSWTSTTTPHKVTVIKGKEYILSEVTAPDGYLKAENITFTAGEAKTITMYDDYTKVLIQKVDENNKPVEGAKLQLSKEDGTIVKTWTSTKDALLFTKLAKGKYVLTELEAPAGYEIAKPVHFEVIDSAKVINVKMVDKLKPEVPEELEMLMSKQDITSKKELPGAKMQLIDKATGKVVDSWTSTTTPHKVTVIKGKEYILSEVTAPDGYLKAENITFTAGESKTITMYDDYTKVLIQKVDENNKPVEGAKLQLSKEDGTVVKTWTSTKDELLFTKLAKGKYVLTELEAPAGYEIAKPVHFEVIDSAKVINVKMVDKLKPEVPEELEMLMSKQDITSKKELPGAKMQLIDKATGKVVDSWTSTTTPHKVTVIKGKEYILSEVTAPDGYLKAENITFTAGEAKTITMYDDYTKVLISKQDYSTHKELSGATLVLKDADNNIVAKWVSNGNPYMVNKLKPGKYFLIEETAPEGYLVADIITFEVKETGEIQKVTMLDKAKPADGGAAISSSKAAAGLAFASAVALASAALIKRKKSEN